MMLPEALKPKLSPGCVDGLEEMGTAVPSPCRVLSGEHSDQDGTDGTACGSHRARLPWEGKLEYE